MISKDFNERKYYKMIKDISNKYKGTKRKDAINKISELRFKKKISGLNDSEIIEEAELMNVIIGNFKKPLHELVDETNEVNMIINEVVKRKR